MAVTTNAYRQTGQTPIIRGCTRDIFGLSYDSKALQLCLTTRESAQVLQAWNEQQAVGSPGKELRYYQDYSVAVRRLQ